MADHPPIQQQARRIPFALRDQSDEMVQGMLAQGVIEPSQSPWPSPVVLVKKKKRWKPPILCRLSLSEQHYEDGCISTAVD